MAVKYERERVTVDEMRPGDLIAHKDWPDGCAETFVAAHPTKGLLFTVNNDDKAGVWPDNLPWSRLVPPANNVDATHITTIDTPPTPQLGIVEQRELRVDGLSVEVARWREPDGTEYSTAALSVAGVDVTAHDQHVEIVVGKVTDVQVGCIQQDDGQKVVIDLYPRSQP